MKKLDSSNQFLAILDRLDLSKFFLIFALLFVTSCGKTGGRTFGKLVERFSGKQHGEKNEHYPFSPHIHVSDKNTEIVCPALDRRILVQYTNAENLAKSFAQFHEIRHRFGSKENYVVGRDEDGEIVYLKGISTDELFANCQFRNVPLAIEQDYIYPQVVN